MSPLCAVATVMLTMYAGGRRVAASSVRTSRTKGSVYPCWRSSIPRDGAGPWTRHEAGCGTAQCNFAQPEEHWHPQADRPASGRGPDRRALVTRGPHRGADRGDLIG